MQRQYELALERIQELEEKYIDLKAEYELDKDEWKEERWRYHIQLSKIINIANGEF